MKFRLTVTAVKEYEVDPAAYPLAIRHDPAAMAELERSAVVDDPDIVLGSDSTIWDTRIEHIS